MISSYFNLFIIIKFDYLFINFNYYFNINFKYFTKYRLYLFLNFYNINIFNNFN